MSDLNIIIVSIGVSLLVCAMFFVFIDIGVIKFSDRAAARRLTDLSGYIVKILEKLDKRHEDICKRLGKLERKQKQDRKK